MAAPTSPRTRSARDGAAGDDVATIVLTWLLLPAAAVAAGLSGLVWLAGQSSALLTGDGWPSVPVTEAPGIGLDLARDPGRPSAAWPHAVRDQIGPGWLVWTLLALLLLALVTVAVLGARRWLVRSVHGRADSGARWATSGEERQMTVPEDPAERSGRLVAGRGMLTRRLLAAEDCISAVGFGPNGSGKTTGLIAPNVLEWTGSVVMTTTKLSDVALIHEQRGKVGPVWVVAPAGAVGFDTVGWSPVDYARDAESADRMAEWLVEASGLSTDAKARPWLVQARKYVKPLLLAAHLTAGGVDAFVRWVYSGQDAVDDIREILLTADEHEAWREYNSTWSIHAEGVGSVLFTAYGLADAYSRPSVRAAAAQGGFSPEFLFGDRPGTLVIVASESDVDRFAPLVTALIAAVIHEAEQRAAAARRAADSPAAAGAGRGGQRVPLPAVGQPAHHRAGQRDPAAARLPRRRPDRAAVRPPRGPHCAVQRQAADPAPRPGRPGDPAVVLLDARPGPGVALAGHPRRTAGTGRPRPASTPRTWPRVHVLRGLPEDVAVVQYRNLPGTRVRLRFCFRDKTLRPLVREAP